MGESSMLSMLILSDFVCYLRLWIVYPTPAVWSSQRGSITSLYSSLASVIPVVNASIFLNPGLQCCCVVEHILWNSYLLRRKFKAHYVLSHPSRDELESPAALVALAATGVSFLSSRIMTNYLSFRFVLPYTLGRPDPKSITRSSMEANSKEFMILTWTFWRQSRRKT